MARCCFRKKCNLNFDPFILPFAEYQETVLGDSDSEYEDWFNFEFAKNEMESFLPENAIQIGFMESENGEVQTTLINDNYYLLPISGNVFNWALFRLSWDDN